MSHSKYIATEKEFPVVLFFQECEETMKLEDWVITINSKGQLMIAAIDRIGNCSLLKVFDRHGNLLQSLQLKLPLTAWANFCSNRVRDIASDRANNVLILSESLNRCRWNTVTVFDHQANFQFNFNLKEGARGLRIAVSDHNKVLVLARVAAKTDRVQVYNFNGELLYSVDTQKRGPTVDLTSIDPEGDKILVLGSYSELRCDVKRKLESVLSEYCVVSGLIRHTYFLDGEHVAELNFSRDELWLYKTNGKFVRKIKLKLSASDYFTIEETFTVTTQGFVAMVTTDKRTGERMIYIL